MSSWSTINGTAYLPSSLPECQKTNGLLRAMEEDEPWFCPQMPTPLPRFLPPLACTAPKTSPIAYAALDTPGC
jgi:hypothetical protein